MNAFKITLYFPSSPPSAWYAWWKVVSKGRVPKGDLQEGKEGQEEGRKRKRIKKRKWTAGYWVTCLSRSNKSKLPIHPSISLPDRNKAFCCKAMCFPTLSLNTCSFSIWFSSFMVGDEQDWDFYGVFPFFKGTECKMDREKNFVKKRWGVKSQLVP